MPDTEAILGARLSTINPIALVTMLKGKGFGLSQILATTNINPELLKNAENQITYGQYRQLIRNALNLTENKALGLEYGHRLNFSGAGIISMGAMAASSFYEALLFCARTTEVISPAVRFDIREHQGAIRLEIIEQLPWEETAPFMVETGFSVVTCIVNMIDPMILSKLVYNFSYPAQADLPVYQAYLPGVHVFDTDSNSLCVPEEFAYRPMPTFNPNAVKQAEEILEQQIQQVRDEKNAITQPIRQMIMESEGEKLSNEEVARRFHVSSRTLNRRLKKLGTSFSELVAEVRYSVARDLLRNSTDSVDQIAHRLGYRDPSNFSKAFRGWSGATPSQFRESGDGEG